jgi:glucose 1-dehydrogenase
MEKQKIALVTGSSSGIGAGIANALAINGYTTVVTYMSHKKWADDIVRSIHKKKGKAVLHKLDVTSEESVRLCFDFVAKKYGHLNILVNNAAIDGVAPIEKCTFDKWKTITRTKIDGNFLCTKYALPLLRNPGKADLIVVMSGLGDKPDPDDIPYSVATAATISFIKGMAIGLAKYGIRTNGVGPGNTRTNNNYWKEAGLTTEKVWKDFARENPLGRVTTPQDIGETVLSIVENKSQFWNGNFIYVNGGEHLK